MLKAPTSRLVLKTLLTQTMRSWLVWHLFEVMSLVFFLSSYRIFCRLYTFGRVATHVSLLEREREETLEGKHIPTVFISIVIESD